MDPYLIGICGFVLGVILGIPLGIAFLVIFQAAFRAAINTMFPPAPVPIVLGSPMTSLHNGETSQHPGIGFHGTSG